jgi:hypothetical protein
MEPSVHSKHFSQQIQCIQGDHSMHPPINVYIDLNEFIKKHDTLQDNLKRFTKKCHTNSIDIQIL